MIRLVASSNSPWLNSDGLTILSFFIKSFESINYKLFQLNVCNKEFRRNVEASENLWSFHSWTLFDPFAKIPMWVERTGVLEGISTSTVQSKHVLPTPKIFKRWLPPTNLKFHTYLFTLILLIFIDLIRLQMRENERNHEVCCFYPFMLYVGIINWLIAK